ncbi:sulfotransferase [Mycobacterium sp. CBMA293]|uniref:sulfotransferase family protein n=2 Tax=Mycolicibacterium TaxID=1866885 RepID=UPI0012DF06E9|nr:MULTISPECIES: sulfotransferase [unclassified Mycolicibacterium]MUL48822.1 sulfotransferase [Mycolicibacterium sp. CBMA 360]MUL62432.1 sulfotransferase [Mycolicibacterium sp. CBMA 335]MUL74123.1 sulfotransferase [Mycolicibacterium sp. CBMA 311]MUL96817.1 sulfotransferase [Mycolicibacterium sp. CBMA 230]MUM03864.1 sulfotransferase family protein [Mycolicibacterium sp. CBMA 213]
MGSAADVVELDDLVAPRLTETQRQILEYAESRRVDLDIEAMLAEAVALAGVDDLADTDGFSDRLAVHVAAIEADEGLTQLTRMTLRSRIIRLLRNRLSLTELVKRYPEIESIEIERPIIVVGMPRSGTTHLVNLIAADPGRRALPYWESQEPIPAPGQGPDIHGVDPRYARSKAEHDAMMATTPLVAAMHDRFPEAIEEEVEVLDLDLASYVLEWHARVPDWRDYYLALDQTRHYAYLKKVLQALTFLRGPRTWVLKSPQHSEQLGPLMATFPDATVAFTHRDPVAVIQSAITMIAYGDRMRRRSIDPGALVDYWADRVYRLLSAGVRDRELVPAERSIDISFHDLNGNEMPLLEKLYSAGGIDLTPKARKGFQTYLTGNPRGKHGRIRYDLQGHFGVSADDLRSRFDFYFDRFDVRPEN